MNVPSSHCSVFIFLKLLATPDMVNHFLDTSFPHWQFLIRVTFANLFLFSLSSKCWSVSELSFGHSSLHHLIEFQGVSTSCVDDIHICSTSSSLSSGLPNLCTQLLSWRTVMAMQWANQNESVSRLDPFLQCLHLSDPKCHPTVQPPTWEPSSVCPLPLHPHFQSNSKLYLFFWKIILYDLLGFYIFQAVALTAFVPDFLFKGFLLQRALRDGDSVCETRDQHIIH